VSSAVFSRVAGLAGGLGAIVIVGGIAVASRLQPGYDQGRQVVSELDQVGSPSAAALELFALLPFAILLALFAAGLHRSIAPGSARGPVLLAGAGFALAAAGLFPCDAGCPIPPVSAAGYLHTGLAVAGLWAATAAPFALADRLDRDGDWRSQHWYAIATTNLATLLFTGFALAAVLQLPVRALLERGLGLVLLAWVAVMAARLFRLGTLTRGSEGERPSRLSPTR